MTLRAMGSRFARAWFGSTLLGLTVLAISVSAAADDRLTAIAPTGSGVSNGSLVSNSSPVSDDASVLPAQGRPASAPATSKPCPSAMSPVDAAPPAEIPTVEVGYGWQTLAFDGAALALGIAQFSTESSGSASTWMGQVGVFTYAAGAPVVHLYHEHTGKALASLGLRVGMPAALALTGGYLLTSTGGNEDLERFGNAVTGVVVGSAIGAVGASVIDAFLIARERVPVSAKRDTVGTLTNLSPTVSVLPHGATVGLSGMIF